MSSPAAQQDVLASLRQWQTKLLQLDRRNSLLYFPLNKRGVALVGQSPDAVLERIAQARRGLKFDYAERVAKGAAAPFAEGTEIGPTQAVKGVEVRVVRGDLDTDLPPLELQRRLANLRKRDREWEEEQGINVLFLALGFLNWVDEDDVAARSPLLLAACDLHCDSPRDPFRLVREDADDLTANTTLRHKLARTAGLELPELGEYSVASYLAAVRAKVAKHPLWVVEESVVLAVFPFSKLAMWEDLEIIRTSGVTHPMVRRLAGDSSAVIARDESEVSRRLQEHSLAGGGLDDLLELKDQFTVINADFSQLRAIELARSGANLVIHGPPGTGKSQTIANVIATLLASGKKVLFVSEKTAALDVVKRRLTDVGLGGFCLDLHSERGKKASVYAQLRESLDQPERQPPGFPLERLREKRNELNRTVRALHEPRLPLRFSAFQIHGFLASIREAPQIKVDVEDIASLDQVRLRAINDAAGRLARRGREFREHLTSRWSVLGDAVSTPRLADLIREDLDRLRDAASAVDRVTADGSLALQLTPPRRPAGSERLRDILAHLSSAPRGVLAHWLTQEGLGKSRMALEELRGLQLRRQSTLESVQQWLGGSPPGSHSGAWLNDASEAIQKAWFKLGSAGDSLGDQIIADPDRVAQRLLAQQTALLRVDRAAGELDRALGGAGIDISIAMLNEAIRSAERLLTLEGAPASWDGIASIDRIAAQTEMARSQEHELAAAEETLGARFEPALAGRVDDEMLVRFRTDYQNFWRRLGGAYRRDLSCGARRPTTEWAPIVGRRNCRHRVCVAAGARSGTMAICQRGSRRLAGPSVPSASHRLGADYC